MSSTTLSGSPMPPKCASCKRASDNAHWGCAARMADGRLFTDYRRRCDVNLLAQAPALSGSYDYRQFLIQNGASIMGQWRGAAEANAVCGTCKEPFDVSTMLPEKDVFRCDKIACARVSRDPSGLGTGRDYGATPDAQAWQKSMLRQHQAASDAAGAAKKDCSCSPNQPMVLSSINASVAANDPRWAVPGGAQPLPNLDEMNR